MTPCTAYLSCSIFRFGYWVPHYMPSFLQTYFRHVSYPRMWQQASDYLLTHGQTPSRSQVPHCQALMRRSMMLPDIVPTTSHGIPIPFPTYASMARETCFLTLTSICIQVRYAFFILFPSVPTDSASCYFYSDSQTYGTRRSSQRWLVANMSTYINLHPSLLHILTAKNLCVCSLLCS
jgi:hypothetical protein